MKITVGAGTALKQIRQQIDCLDDQLVLLVEQRLALAEQAAVVKYGQNLPLMDAEREAAIIRRLTQNKPQELAGAIAALFTALFALSRSRQTRVYTAPVAFAEELPPDNAAPCAQEPPPGDAALPRCPPA